MRTGAPESWQVSPEPSPRTPGWFSRPLPIATDQLACLPARPGDPRETCLPGQLAQGTFALTSPGGRRGEGRGPGSLRHEEPIPEGTRVTSTILGHVPPGELLKERPECEALSHLRYICSISSRKNRSLGCRKWPAAFHCHLAPPGAPCGQTPDAVLPAPFITALSVLVGRHIVLSRCTHPRRTL